MSEKTAQNLSSPPHQQHIIDNDSDLSFEALTFGDNGGNNNDNLQDKNGARQLPKKNKDKFRKKTSSKKEPPHTPEGEREKNTSVYISTLDDKIDVQALLRKLELFGAVKGYYFKEKQNFGIVQFVDPAVVDAVIENFSSDDLGFHVTVERSVRNKEVHASPHSFGSIPATPSITSPVPSTPPPEKPDTILVLKNLPFTLKQDQLHEILLSLSTTIPQSISLHYDNAGVFRGMAFIKYRQLEDAIQVYELLNGMDVGGRKVRVEYKRKAANNIPVEWQEDEELRKLWEQLNHFKDDPAQFEWYYPSTLTNNQRRHIYNMTEKLKLVQCTSGDGEIRTLFLRKGPWPQTPTHLEHSGSVDSKRGIDIKGRGGRPRRDSDTNVRPGSSPNSVGEQARSQGRNSLGKSESVKQQQQSQPQPQQHTISSSAPADINLDWRHQPNQNQAHSPAHTQQPALVAPLRQPKGPDGSKGFADQYRTSRKLTLPTTCAFLVPLAQSEVVV